jgi:hypothetical protein
VRLQGEHTRLFPSKTWKTGCVRLPQPGPPNRLSCQPLRRATAKSTGHSREHIIAVLRKSRLFS